MTGTSGVRSSVHAMSVRCVLKLVRQAGGAEVVPGVPFFPEHNADGELHPTWHSVAGGGRIMFKSSEFAGVPREGGEAGRWLQVPG